MLNKIDCFIHVVICYSVQHVIRDTSITNLIQNSSMGNFAPTALAFLLTYYGTMIFTKLEDELCTSCCIFLLTIFFLIWNCGINLKSLKRHWCLQLCIELLISKFTMEELLVQFWYPLEDTVLGVFPRLAINLETVLSEPPFEYYVNMDWLHGPITRALISILISSFLLVTILHVTRTIDLRGLEQGPRFFLHDTYAKLIRYATKRVSKLLKKLSSKKVRSNSCDLRKKLDQPKEVGQAGDFARTDDTLASDVAEED
ncbi:uncharacterized protein LOC109606632 [Aethina tumida]|uniref:uncharacterized protein LOC109606632 n=1 Tax=Aethina tumida TaxID=116153 RepID=UPI00214910E8|nr:uncharacterized protein LOC109606632 [Aethina tumida]XP_049818862.1 uncharacterized protein LOC109606632 [Aethina tumida]